MKSCPACGQAVSESKRFCSYCGEKLSETEGLQTEALSAEGDIRTAVAEHNCPSCGRTLPMATAKFCRYCGASLHEPLPSVDVAAAESASPSFRSLTPEVDDSTRKTQLFFGVMLAVVFVVAALIVLGIPNSVSPERLRGPAALPTPSAPPPRPTTPGPPARKAIPRPTAPSNGSASVAPPVRPDTPVAVRPEPGLVAYYSFNGDALDHSGKANHGNAFGSLRYENGSAVFDGQTTYILVPHSPSLELTEFTLTVWMTPYRVQPGETILRKGSCDYCLNVGPKGNAIFGVAHRVGITFVHALDALQPNTRYFVAATVDSRAANIFIDAQLSRTVRIFPPLQQHGQPLAIGAEPLGTIEKHFSGLIDEIRIYNRVLSDAELLGLFQRRKSYS